MTVGIPELEALPRTGSIWGYLNSANSYLNLVYETVLPMSPTGKSVTDKAFWEGHCIGWLEMVYAYDEPIEIDLNQAVLEYDIEMPESGL